MTPTFRTICFALLVTAAVFVTGCPRLAYVRFFNNSGAEVRLVSDAQDYGVIAHDADLKFRFIGDTIEVWRGTDRWLYDREIPFKGEDGPYFDGTLRVQLQSDGGLYALKVREVAPLAQFSEQPAGFPLKPKHAQPGATDNPDDAQ